MKALIKQFLRFSVTFSWAICYPTL